MKICLVQPAYSSNLLEISLPLGLLSIATELKRSGHDVVIKDLQYLLREGKIKKNNYYNDSIKYILDCKPDIVGFTSMSVSHLNAIKLMERIKHVNDRIITIIGGPQATLEPKKTLLFSSSIDYVVCGEGEKTTLDLIDAINKDTGMDKVESLWYRKGNEIIHNSNSSIMDINHLQDIEYDILKNIDDYIYQNTVTNTPIEVGRGCPYNCTFCSTSIVWNRTFRLKSPKKITDEINYLYKKYHISRFTFIHDNIAVNRVKLLELCDEIKDKDFKIKWGASCRVDNLDLDLLTNMKESGCVGLFLGIETGSSENQKRIKKNLDLCRIDEIIRSCLGIGIDTTLSFIIGYPFETIKQLNETLSMAIKLKAIGAMNIQIHVLKPESKTELTEKYFGSLIFDEKYIQNCDDELLNCDSEDMIRIKENKELFTCFYRFRNENYSIKFIGRIAIIMRWLLFYFPKTPYLIMKMHNIRPYDIMKDLEMYYLSNYKKLSDQNIYEGFTFLMEKIYLIPENITEYYLFEKRCASFKLRREEKISCKSDQDCFKLKFYIETIDINADILKINEYIRNNNINEIINIKPKKTNIILIKQDRDVIKTIIGISKLKKYILQLLTQDNYRLNDLYECCLTKWNHIEQGRLKDEINKSIKSLKAEGLIY